MRKIFISTLLCFTLLLLFSSCYTKFHSPVTEEEYFSEESSTETFPYYYSPYNNHVFQSPYYNPMYNDPFYSSWNYSSYYYDPFFTYDPFYNNYYNSYYRYSNHSYYPYSYRNNRSFFSTKNKFSGPQRSRQQEERTRVRNSNSGNNLLTSAHQNSNYSFPLSTSSGGTINHPPKIPDHKTQIKQLDETISNFFKPLNHPLIGYNYSKEIQPIVINKKNGHFSSFSNKSPNNSSNKTSYSTNKSSNNSFSKSRSNSSSRSSRSRSSSSSRSQSSNSKRSSSNKNRSRSRK